MVLHFGAMPVAGPAVAERRATNRTLGLWLLHDPSGNGPKRHSKQTRYLDRTVTIYPRLLARTPPQNEIIPIILPLKLPLFFSLRWPNMFCFLFYYFNYFIFLLSLKSEYILFFSSDYFLFFLFYLGG